MLQVMFWRHSLRLIWCVVSLAMASSNLFEEDFERLSAMSTKREHQNVMIDQGSITGLRGPDLPSTKIKKISV